MANGRKPPHKPRKYSDILIFDIILNLKAKPKYCLLNTKSVLLQKEMSINLKFVKHGSN